MLFMFIIRAIGHALLIETHRTASSTATQSVFSFNRAGEMMEWEAMLQAVKHVLHTPIDCLVGHRPPASGPAATDAETLFKKIDIDGNGQLDVAEVAAFLEPYGVGLDPQQVYELLDDADIDRSGGISMPEFRHLLHKLHMPPKVPEAAFVEAWLDAFHEESGSAVFPTLLPSAQDPRTLAQWVAAATIAGSVSRTAAAPLIRLKILAQVQTTVPRVYEPLLPAVRDVVAAEGVRGLWRGNLINVLRCGPWSGCCTFLFLTGLTMQTRESSRNRLIIGSISAGLTTLLLHPLEVVHTRLSVQQGPSETLYYRGITHAVRRIVAEEGARGLYKGLAPALAMIIPFCAIHAVLNWNLRVFARMCDLDSKGTKVACSATAAAAAQLLTYPCELINHRMAIQHRPFLESAAVQVDDRSVRLAGSARRGVVATVRTTISEAGVVKGLWGGCNIALTRCIFGICVSVYTRESVFDHMPGDASRIV